MMQNGSCKAGGCTSLGKDWSDCLAALIGGVLIVCIWIVRTFFRLEAILADGTSKEISDAVSHLQPQGRCEIVSRLIPSGHDRSEEPCPE
jgi:hypothetical protein